MHASFVVQGIGMMVGAAAAELRPATPDELDFRQEQAGKAYDRYRRRRPGH
jgi:hypothetical protein